MYNFMIVDDDKLIRERLLSVIPSKKLGLTLCGEAENGVQALEIFQSCHPQIVIMDVNIPIINGIDAAAAMLEEDPDVNVVIVTGHGTLPAAQAALRSGVIDFLLKPVNSAELTGVLRKIIQKIQEQAGQALERQRMECLLERSMPLLRSRYFLSLMKKPPEEIDPADCRQRLADFGITDPGANVCVSLIVSNYETPSMGKQLSMQSILEEELEKRLEIAGIGCLFLYDMMQRMILIAYGTQKQLGMILEQKFSSVRDKMRYVHRLDFHASIGSVIPGFLRLRESYQDAERALDYWNVLGNNNIVNSSTVNNIDLPNVQVPSIRYGEIMDLLIAENLADIRSTFDAYLNQISYIPQSSMPYVQRKAIELTALLLSCADELGAELNAPLSEQPMVYVRILSAERVLDVRRMVIDTAEAVVACIHSKRKDNKARALSSAKQYVLQNFTNPNLDLSRVAESVNLSPNYVAQLFKRYEDCNFTEYLNRVRIDRAKKLLMTTHMRVYEVSEAVGYQNSKYFFQLFKQITGMRPREFYESSVASSRP